MSFVEHYKFKDFKKDPKTQSAVLHQLMILGEAAKRISKEFAQNHPEIPWSLIARIRDRLIHMYDDVDLQKPQQRASQK